MRFFRYTSPRWNRRFPELDIFVLKIMSWKGWQRRSLYCEVFLIKKITIFLHSLDFCYPITKTKGMKQKKQLINHYLFMKLQCIDSKPFFSDISSMGKKKFFRRCIHQLSKISLSIFVLCRTVQLFFCIQNWLWIEQDCINIIHSCLGK